MTHVAQVREFVPHVKQGDEQTAQTVPITVFGAMQVAQAPVVPVMVAQVDDAAGTQTGVAPVAVYR